MCDAACGDASAQFERAREGIDFSPSGCLPARGREVGFFVPAHALAVPHVFHI